MSPGDPIPCSIEEVKFWFSELDASESRLKGEFLTRLQYPTLIKYYEGIQDGKVGVDKLAIIDELSPGVNAVIKTAYYQNPSVSVKAANPTADGMVTPSLIYLMQNPDFQPFSLTALMDGAIKYGMDKGGAKEAMQLGCFDVLTAGFVVIEVNIESQAVYANRPAQMTQEAEADPLAEAAQTQQQPQGFLPKAIGAVKSLFGIEPKTPDEVDEKLSAEQSYECVGTKDDTYWKRWRPDHILFDARAENFSESRFISKVSRKSHGEFKLMFPDFANRPIPSETMSDLSYAGTKADKDRKAVTIYELQIKKYDQETGETYIQVLKLVRGIPEAVESKRLIFNTNGFTLKYKSLDKYGKLYPISRVKKAKKSQDDLNNLATIQMEHATRALRKVAYDKNAFDADGMAQLNKGDVFGLVPKNRPTAAFEQIPQSPAIQDNPLLQEALRDSINKQIGTNELAKSGDSKNDLLGQDQLQNEAFQTQVSQVQDVLGDIAEECVDCQKDIIQQLWDDEKFFKVTGIKGASAWYDPAMGPISDLAIGDYQIEVDIVSAMKPNPMKGRSDAVQFAQWLVSQEVQMYLMARGKTTNIKPIENVIKQFDFDPDSILEELPAPPQPQETGGEAGAPQNIPVPQRQATENAVL